MTVSQQEQTAIWDKLFKVKERQSTVMRELFAGCTSFLCVAYILAVNPIILGEAGMDMGAVFTATAVSAFIMTLVLSLYANAPFVGVAGMGINAFLAYTVVVQMEHSFMFALTAQLLSGLIFLLIAVTPFKDLLFNAIPQNIKLAVTAGIGLFITMIGLGSSGIIVATPGTMVGIGSLHNPAVLITLIGIILIAVFTARQVKGGIFLAVIICTCLAWGIGLTQLPDKVVAMPPSMGPVMGKFAWDEVMQADMLFVTFTFLFVNLFNVVGVTIGLTDQVKVSGEESRKTNGRSMAAAALGTVVASLLGTSAHIVAVESAAGIAEGGRTGLTALTAAVLFLAALFFAPLLMIIPAAATAPVLIVVGLFMVTAVKGVDFEDISEGIPAFLTIIMMPFAYSIGIGIEWGLVSYVIIKVLTGKHKDISLIMYVLSLIFIGKELFM